MLAIFEHLFDYGVKRAQHLACWTLPSTFVGVTPGSGSNFAGHLNLAGRINQGVVPVDESGHVWGTKPSFIVVTKPTTLSPQSRNALAIFNGSGSGFDVEIEAILVSVDPTSVARATPNFVDISIARITSLGPVGTGIGSIGGIARPFVQLNPLETVPNTIWCSEGGSSNNFSAVTSIFNQIFAVDSTSPNVNLQTTMPLWPPQGLPMQIVQTLACPPGYGLRINGAQSLGVAAFFTIFCSISSFN